MWRWEGARGRWARNKRKAAGMQGSGADGGRFQRYALVDPSRGLGSDTSFEQSHATSKTFKLSSLLLQIKLPACVRVLCVFLFVLVRCEEEKGKGGESRRKWFSGGVKA